MIDTSIIATESAIKLSLASNGLESGENRTADYLRKIDMAFDGLIGKPVIDHSVYSKFVLALPGNLACKLRLTPDNNLVPRISHLYAMYTAIVQGDVIAGFSNYSIVSIEGSNKKIPFDCDLVIVCNNTGMLAFIDFTSSTNANIIESKMSVLANNLTTSGLSNAIAHVEVFEKKSMATDIRISFESNEPGTIGLKLMDMICRQPKEKMDAVLNQMELVYEMTNEELSKLDNTCAPGDYKDYSFEEEIISTAADLVKTQKDKESLSFLKDMFELDPERFPYYKDLDVLALKAHKLKKLVPIEGAVVFETRDLQSNLAMLEDNWLCKALHAATLTENVVAIDEADNITILPDFPCNPKDEVLPVLLSYKACIRQKKGHVFNIKFNPSFIDEKLRRVLVNDPVIKDKKMFTPAGTTRDERISSFVNDSIADYSNDLNSFTSISLEQPKDSIWKKMQTISALASNDLDNMGRTTCAMFDNYLAMIEKMYLGSCLAHFYEINKSILASLKVSPGSSEYYVGVNGSFCSITIVKMCSTLDSFSKTNYSVISKLERNSSSRRVRLDGTTTNGIFFSKFYSIDPMSLSYNLRLPMTISSFATWEIENNMENGSIQNGKTPQIIFDAALHALVNRDQFAQAAEQVRYFYLSAIGYGGSASDISDKVTFMFTRHSWENIYLLRSYKLAACLNVLSATKQLPRIEDHSTKELLVAFPHSTFPSKSFSQTISSMYVCNIYNKFRAFHEVSGAMCYTSILDELQIYKDRVSEDENAVSGVSPNLITAFGLSETSAMDYMLTSEFVIDEVAFNVTLAAVKSQRYSGSMSYIMGSTLFHSTTSSSTVDNIFHKLAQCPIEACTMRGSMDKGPSTEAGQGLRAASAVLEEIIRGYNLDPKSINKSVLGAANLFDRMSEDSKNFSLFSFVLMQFCLITDAYRYRITDKDQKGHREISVLNIVFRMGALFVETISRELSSEVGDTEVVHKPNKDKIVEDAIKEAFKEAAASPGARCFDNNDQKRWGPNHNMNFFSFMMTPMLRSEPGLMRMVVKVFDKTFDKRAKFPEPLIKLIMNKKVRHTRSEPLQKFIDMCAPKMDNKVFETVLPMGMCQGIYHDTSSVAHAFKAKSAIHLATLVVPSVGIHYFTTSDDSEGIIKMAAHTDVIETVKVVHVTGLRVGNLFNIVRSNPKSAFNFIIAELNSIFYKKGKMATPSLKQRISKVDVGNGVNHVEDYLSIMASSANYLASGGSYMGAYIITILNFVLHTEQWLRWDFAKSDHYYKPVEMGGFPVIEPISTILSGGISNLYMRSAHILSPENYARVITSTLLCPPERIALSEFARSGSESVKASYATDDLTVFKGTGPFGLFQTVRTDRKLSVFERRHGISKWVIPESFVNIDRRSADAQDFLFTIFRNTSVNTLETNLGVNSFFVRLAEPWVSYDRNCFIVSKNSPMAPTFGGSGNKISHRFMKERLFSYDLASASAELEIAYRRCIRHPEFEIMETQLTVRLSDALSLLKFLRSQEAESFKTSVTSPSIQTVTLRGQSASDSDAYFLSILKAMSGKGSKMLINEFRRSNKAYDSIDVPEPRKPVSILDTIVFADNAVSLYEKFVRRDTKMIIPNNVDDMRQLCLDILRNKFTERMGIVVTGKLEMNEERSRPYAYTKWYQELLKLSEKREKNLAMRALNRTAGAEVLCGIDTPRGLITKRDMFSIGDTSLPEKTVLVSAQNKSMFVSTVKSWIAANVKFALDRETINNLIRGRLTFAHDYFIGDNLFMRNPKTQYMKVSSRSATATHFISTKVSRINGRVTTSYDHTFLFKDNISGSSVRVEPGTGSSDEAWISNLTKDMVKVSRIVPDRWYSVSNKSSSSLVYNGHRKTINEVDRFRFVYITPSSDFRVEVMPDSLTIMLVTGDFRFPIAYAMPVEIDSMSYKITLTDQDFKIATKFYTMLSKETNGFRKDILRRKRELASMIDFILVETTPSTEDSVMKRYFEARKHRVLSSKQVDIVRTMLVNNREIGVNFSSHRFTTSLLNMNQRRKPGHTFFTRRITGERIDYDSEDISEDSDSEEMIKLGTITEAEVIADDSTDPTIVPKYLKRDMALGELMTGESWADMAEQEENDKLEAERIREEARMKEIEDSRSVTGSELEVDTRNEDHLFSDSDDDSDIILVNPVLTDSAQQDVSSSPIPEVTLTSQSPGMIDMAAAAAVEDIFSDLMGGVSFDDMFEIDSDDNDEVPANSDMLINEVDAMLTKSMNDTYGKIVEEKDTALKSVVTGHTVDGNLENARPLIKYLKGWLDNEGKMREFEFMDDTGSNVSKLTSVYLMMESMGVLDMVNPIMNMFGTANLQLPIELSALTVINSMYM